MKKQILTGLIFLSLVLTINAQNAEWIPTPNTLSTSASVGIGTGYNGVGTIMPIEKLTIGEMGGNFAVQDRRTSTSARYSSGYKFYDYNGESASILLEHNGYFGNSARALKFFVNGTERIRINSGGNIGIGTTTPSSKLTVNGKILAKEVEVVSSISSDYVFEPDYQLMTLTDLELYLKQNKHLPGIPSAEEFSKTGQNLAKTDDMLLRKIEELTLYTIEQNKLIELQNEKILELEKQNARIQTLENEVQEIRSMLKM